MTDDDKRSGNIAGVAVASTTPAICSQCQQPLTSVGSDGECLRCLFGFALAGDEQNNSGEGSSDRATTSPRRYGHFEVALDADGRALELGAGAMAVTYRAVDTILNCPVALKVIDQRLASHPAARARFLREARAAAKLRHPNIARVSHYGEQDGECYYVMELVDGETLDARVRREGPFAPAVALEITSRVTQALVAADAGGVVHRDLKPSNIMLETRGTSSLAVKVIDWGLAKAVETGSALAIDHTFGGFVGTPTYASPEQVAPKNEQRVDARSDIYSLGVTLWYLLCGRTPFVGGTLDEIHRKQVSRALPIEQLTAARVPRPIIALLRSMIAADPGDRPQSARELLARLERCRRQLATAVRNRKLWLRLGTAALVVSMTVWAARMVLQRRTAQAAADRSVAVLPFENLSPDKTVAFFTAGMQDSITDELARIAQLKVVGSESTRSFLPGQRNFAEIGRELGVTYLVEGSVWRERDRMRVSIQLVNARTQKRDWSKEYEKPASDVFAIQREVTREVATRLRATLSAGETAALNEPPTRDPVAYDLYLQARGDSRQFKNSAELLAAMNRRLQLLEEAVQRDPNFMLAYLMIADAHDEIYGDQAPSTPDEKAVDHRALAEVALQKARRISPDDGRLHLAQAAHFLSAVRDDEQARIEVDLARKTLPNNVDLEQIAGLIAYRQGRMTDAVRCLEKGATLAPRETVMFTDLSWVYRAMRRYEDADRVARRLLALRPGNEKMYVRVYRATLPLEERGDLAPLRALLAAETPADDADADFLNKQRLIVTTYERDSDGMLRALGALKAPPVDRSYPNAWFEGWAAKIRGDKATTQAAFSAAKVELTRLLEISPGSSEKQGVLAMVDANLGLAAEAERGGLRSRELAEKKSSVMSKLASKYYLAAVYAEIGKSDKAIALLEELVKKPATEDLLYQPTYGVLQLDPMWDPLRGDPRFKALVESLAPKMKRPLG